MRDKRKEEGNEESIAEGTGEGGRGKRRERNNRAFVLQS